ncbi:MAG: site-specific integrase, partial [Geminicoccaceae bacterium]
LLTGQRREEVAGMCWKELDLERGLWSLTADRTKNGQAHDVPLSDMALGILKGLRERGGRELIFGEGKGAFSGWSQAKMRLDRRSGVSGWRVHDFRRTVVTGMAELGVQPHIIEAAVNHLSGHRAGVAGIYYRATYATEKTNAMNRWAHHVGTVVNKNLTETAIIQSSVKIFARTNRS